MDAATIEQMNKVRASVGLPLLPVPGKTNGPQFKTANDSGDDDDEEDISTLDKRQALADSNWQKLENERLERIERQKRKDAAKKARDAMARTAKLEGTGLGEADVGGDLDTRSWLLQQKKRQKKIEQARKMEAELAEREREMQAQYTSKDLAGVKVGHEIDDFDGMTDEKILTLKDAAIGEDSEDDLLENQDLKEQEKLQERLQLKKKRPDYDPTEQGEAKGLLSKYDEEIEGRKQKRFKLDGQGTSVEAAQKRHEDVEKRPANRIKINLDMLQDETPSNDYLETKIKVKKPKKTKEKKTRQRDADEDGIVPVQPVQATDSMEIDGAPVKKRGLDLDDDDLQAQLAEQRRQALKKRKKMDAAELARQMRDEMPVDEEEPEEGGLVLDETSEFVANLKNAQVSDDEDEEMHNHAPERSTMAMDVDHEGAELPYTEAAATDSGPITSTGLEEEESMGGRGIAGTLALLRKRGIIEDKDAARTAEKERQRAQFLAEKQDLVDEFDRRAKQQREADRQSGRYERMSNREREQYAKQQNDVREAYLAKLQADMFNKNYKPDVKLEYHDEFGRSMNQKEAFKHLSHSFHGKASGKQKTEKRLKKIADEQREMAKGTINVSEQSGMSYIQGREGKRTKQAGVRLQ